MELLRLRLLLWAMVKLGDKVSSDKRPTLPGRIDKVA